MTLPSKSLIRPKQIDLSEWPNPRDHIAYVKILKALSAAGFVWTKDDFAWHRERDDGGISDEALADVVRMCPLLVDPLLKAIEKGASGFNFVNGELPDGSWSSQLVPIFNVINAFDAATVATIEKLSIKPGEIVVVKVSREHIQGISPSRLELYMRRVSDQTKEVIAGLGLKNQVIITTDDIDISSINAVDLLAILRNEEEGEVR